MTTQICTRCVLDETDPDISFNSDGVCNHCLEAETIIQNHNASLEHIQTELNKLVEEMKVSGRGNPYNCIIGVSGGVDSTYVAYLVKKLGLSPIAIHLDNGWNSELAVQNIENTLKKLNIDLITKVLDWEEFRDLQLSFLKASTPDSEIPTDHAITALLYQYAVKLNVKYVISGSNIATECVMPRAWSQGHADWKYIKSVQKIFGSKKLKTFPHCSLSKFLYYKVVKRIKLVKILNYVDYNKQKALLVLKDELNWRDYGGKHHESIYTRFFQSHILPNKFGYDKRKGHLSSLICSGQISRSDALRELETLPCPIETQTEDKIFVSKKLGISVQELQKIIDSPKKRFEDYPSYRSGPLAKVDWLRDLYRKLRR